MTGGLRTLSGLSFDFNASGYDRNLNINYCGSVLTLLGLPLQTMQSHEKSA